MSFRSPARPATIAAAPADIEAVRRLAMIPLAAFALLAQLDALANRVSAALPIGTTELLIAAIVGCTLLILLHPASATTQHARGHDGARLMALLFAWAVFAWTLSTHRSEGIDYLTGLATAIVPALCLLVIADTPVRLQLLLWAMIAAGLVSAAIVIVETRTGMRILSTSLAATTADFEGVARSAGGSDENPTTAAQMLLVSVGLAFGLLFAGVRRGWPVLALLAAIGSVALAMASARSAILGLAAVLGLLMLSLRHDRRFPLLVLGAIVAMLAAIPFLPPTLVERFAAIGDFSQDQTLFRRLTYLRIGTDLVQQSPIWGVGPGNFPFFYLDDAYRWLPGRVAVPRELHNSYLDSAAEYGLVGLAIFGALVTHALLQARRAAHAGDPLLRQAGLAAGLALAGLLVACFFMPHKDLRYLWLMLAIAIQCGRLRAREETP
ncbi:O-antigen ligase family protein [Sphingomonas baiyangensis]|nr:O-antigen ligase family protein [Sphingomonas baiyangensis]